MLNRVFTAKRINVGGHTIYGHNGDAIGQSAFLRLLPERDIAVALLTNGGQGVPLHHQLLGHVLRELAGVELPALPVPSPGTIDASRYLGGYGNSITDITISQDDSVTVWAEQVPTAALPAPALPRRHPDHRPAAPGHPPPADLPRRRRPRQGTFPARRPRSAPAVRRTPTLRPDPPPRSSAAARVRPGSRRRAA
ncbi:hypothetical protein [Streptosporangium roseum]|uniref:hypothetical protein n=1 Tax=Streptosporangium roseum TaxID=2001 RepID=UPI0012DE9774|nr:hypothetical protein [Streptosporangium roseum]